MAKEQNESKETVTDNVDEAKDVIENEEAENKVKDKTVSKDTVYTLKVDKPFTDKNNRTIKYKVNDTLTTDDKKRVKDLTKRGLAHVIK